MTSQPDFWTSYPQRAGFKESTTSRDAATKIEATGRAAKLRAVVIGAFELGFQGTADELAANVGESVLAIRPRVSELHKQGRLEPTGERRSNSSGASAHVWRLTRRIG